VTPLLSVEGVCVSYRRHRALDGVFAETVQQVLLVRRKSAGLQTCVESVRNVWNSSVNERGSMALNARTPGFREDGFLQLDPTVDPNVQASDSYS